MRKVKLEICSGTSCHLMGSFDLNQVVNNLKPQYKEHLEISVIPCLGECGEGPNIRFNGILYTQVTPERLKKMIIQSTQK
ncbi:MAG: hypothetical protein PWQ67_270 [Clostridia bacterium]|nr:hypothetical protein [Clostridia bacterium]MDN5321816.1 hypothetical protein [Clostridia bacterium]